jgi:anti-sigma regulatory factor (Ser/Thr protein kinase)
MAVGMRYDTGMPTTTTSLETVPASVTQARALVVECAAARGWSGPVDDAAVAVTEAATNAVLHAYPSGGGDFTVDVRFIGGAMEVTVEDRGTGFMPGDPRGPRTGLGMGLHLIARLSTRCEVRSLPGRGTRVTMTFAG